MAEACCPLCRRRPLSGTAPWCRRCYYALWAAQEAGQFTSVAATQAVLDRLAELEETGNG